MADSMVRVFVTVESDGGVRPVEILGHYYPDGKDLPPFPLALSSHELR
jgi:hypothetical protein